MVWKLESMRVMERMREDLMVEMMMVLMREKDDLSNTVVVSQCFQTGIFP